METVGGGRFERVTQTLVVLLMYCNNRVDRTGEVLARCGDIEESPECYSVRAKSSLEEDETSDGVFIDVSCDIKNLVGGRKLPHGVFCQ